MLSFSRRRTVQTEFRGPDRDRQETPGRATSGRRRGLSRAIHVLMSFKLSAIEEDTRRKAHPLMPPKSQSTPKTALTVTATMGDPYNSTQEFDPGKKPENLDSYLVHFDPPQRMGVCRADSDCLTTCAARLRVTQENSFAAICHNCMPSFVIIHFARIVA